MPWPRDARTSNMPSMSERTETTLVHGKPVRFRLRRSKRARSLKLRVSPGAGLEVVLPWRWALRDVDHALHKHAAWIDEQVDRFGVRHGPRSRELVTGVELPIEGVTRRLRLRPLPEGRVRARIDLVGDELVAELSPADLLDPRPVLRRWLRRHARARLEERVRHFAGVHGFEPQKVIVGERRSRWGSCSARGTLSFCDRLIMAPPAVLDAVVCHELAHLRHLNHGAGFRALVRRICPTHDEGMAWLRDHHDELEF